MNPTENGNNAVVGGWDEVKMGSTISYLKTLFKNLFVFYSIISDGNNSKLKKKLFFHCIIS